MIIETITHPSGDQLPILLDGDGLPIPSPNEFILSRRYLSTNTLVRNLRELAVFYRWLGKSDLRERILSNKFFTEGEIQGSLIESLRRDQGSSKAIVKLAIKPKVQHFYLPKNKGYLYIFGLNATKKFKNSLI